MKTILKTYLPLALLYLLVAIVFTYPLITQFFTHIPGGEEDAPTHVWLLWWFKYSIFDLHINPIFTDFIYYPQIINRTFDIHTWTNGLLSLPFQYMLGLIPASNIVFLSSFVLSGLGAFSLVKYLTKSSLAAFVSGLIYGFFPYVLGQASDNHTNLTTIWFTPFFVWLYLRALEEAKYKYAVLAGIILGLQGLNDLTYTSFNLALTILITFYYLVFRFKNLWTLKYLKLGLVFGVTFLIFFAPMLSLAIYTIAHGFKPDVPLYVQEVWSADLWYFFYPPTTNPFLHQWSKAPLVRSAEATLYIGYTVLGLALLAKYLFWKTREQRFHIGLFKLIFATFFILSLGPWLHVWGNIPTIAGSKIPLPFIIYQLLPLIGGIQEPMRFQPLTMLGLTVLVGFSLSWLLTKLNSKFLKYSLITCVCGLILFEYIPTPFPTADTTPPDVYKQISQEDDDFAILDLPVGWNTGNFLYGYGPIGTLQLYQATHQKKIFRGTVARLPVQNIVYYQTIPLLKYLAKPTTPDNDDLNPELVKKTFKDLKVKYIFIHRKYYEAGNRTLGQGEDLIQSVLKAKKFYDQEGVVGYRLF